MDDLIEVPAPRTLPVTEVFLSIQGETSSMGMPTVFVRLWGCNLHCPGWPCDSLNAVLTETPAWKQGHDLGVDAARNGFNYRGVLIGELLRGFVAGVFDEHGAFLPSGNIVMHMDRPTADFVSRAMADWNIPYVRTNGEDVVITLESQREGVQSVQNRRRAFLDAFRPEKADAAGLDTWKRNWQGDRKTVEQVVAEALRVAAPVDANGLRATYCTITGGEPTLHGDAFVELARNLAQHFHVNVETNGSRPIPWTSPDLDSVRWTVDFKPVSSGENKHMLIKQYAQLRHQDEIKIVAASVADVELAAEALDRLVDRIHAQVLVSPVYGTDMQPVVAWVLAHRPQWRVQLQLHKIIWPGANWGI